jgi:hypothetical protein
VLVNVEPGAGDTIDGGKLLVVAVVPPVATAWLFDAVEVLETVWLIEPTMVLDTSRDGRLSFPDVSYAVIVK